jgi:hypothetical protein
MFARRVGLHLRFSTDKVGFHFSSNLRRKLLLSITGQLWLQMSNSRWRDATVLLRSRLGIQKNLRRDDALRHTPKGLNCEILLQYRYRMLSNVGSCWLAEGGASVSQYIQRLCNTEITGVMQTVNKLCRSVLTYRLTTKLQPLCSTLFSRHFPKTVQFKAKIRRKNATKMYFHCTVNEVEWRGETRRLYLNVD